jgi:hypothetical protein
MHKLLPFRQYDEKDVINLFALDYASITPGADLINLKVGSTAANNGANWSGTGVAVDSGSTLLGGDDPTLTSKSYLGAIGSGDQGFALQEGNPYPEAPMVVGLASSASRDFLGLTLKPTLAYDENGEKLLYYRRKLEELQAVLPGETVPVATRGMFTMTVGTASDGNAIATGVTPGQVLTGANANGQFAGAALSTLEGSSSVVQAGRVLATGTNGGKNVALVMIGTI